MTNPNIPLDLDNNYVIKSGNLWLGGDTRHLGGTSNPTIFNGQEDAISAAVEWLRENDSHLSDHFWYAELWLWKSRDDVQGPVHFVAVDRPIEVYHDAQFERLKRRFIVKTGRTHIS